MFRSSSDAIASPAPRPRPIAADLAAVSAARPWLLVLLAAALLALSAAPSLADTDSIAADVDRQLEEVEEETAPGDFGEETEGRNTELWEEYKEYRDETRELEPGVVRPSGERVKIGGDIVVQANERIRGDVVAVGGSVTVFGEVDGDAVAVGGPVNLHDGAVVRGDAVSVGSRVEQLGDDVVVHGETVSVDIGFDFGHFDFNISPFKRRPRIADFGFHVVWILVCLGFALLFYAIAGRRLDVVSRRVETEPGQSFLVGLLGAFATPFALVIATVLLAVTVIGIFLIPVLFIVIVLMIIGGFVAVTLAVGRRVAHVRDTGGELSATRSPYFYIFVGFLVLEGFILIASLLRLIPFMGPVAGLLTVLGTFVVVFASILGYGALMMSRLGTEPGTGSPIVIGAYIDTGRTPPPPPPPGTGPPPGAGSPPPQPSAGPTAPAGPEPPTGPAAPTGPGAPPPPPPSRPPSPDAGEGPSGYDRKLEGYDPSSPDAPPPPGEPKRD